MALECGDDPEGTPHRFGFLDRMPQLTGLQSKEWKAAMHHRTAKLSHGEARPLCQRSLVPRNWHGWRVSMAIPTLVFRASLEPGDKTHELLDCFLVDFTPLFRRR